MKRSPFIFFAGAVALAALPLHASALRTWCGSSGEQDWSASTNWVNGLVAMTNDTAYFPHNNAYHANGTGKRRYWFKVTPPEGFTGTVLTTNELWSNDSVSASYLNVSFCPTVELTVLDNAAWNVDGNGTVVASDGIASRLSGSFAGTVEVRKGTTFVPSPSLNPAVRFTGAGTLALSSGSRFAQVEAFAGSIECSSEGMGDSVTVLALKGSSVTLADGQTLSFDPGSLMYSPVQEIESFADDPESGRSTALHGRKVIFRAVRSIRIRRMCATVNCGLLTILHRFTPYGTPTGHSG